MGETSEYHLDKAAAAVVEYLSQGPPLYELPVADTRKAIDDAQAHGTVPMPAVDEAWVTVPADVGDVGALIIKPRGATGRLPAVLYMPGSSGAFTATAASPGSLQWRLTPRSSSSTTRSRP
jgi:hypothetical protein